MTEIICLKSSLKVFCRSHEAVSQSLIVLSLDAEASCLPSGEKVTELIWPKWPSSLCNNSVQAFNTLNSLLDLLDIKFLNLFLIILISGANINTKEYIYNNIISSMLTFIRVKRHASYKKLSKAELLPGLVNFYKLAIILTALNILLIKLSVSSQ